MMDNVGLWSTEDEGSGNSWEKMLEPVIGTNSENIVVKIEECNREDFEEDFDTKLELFNINGLLDVKPMVEDNLDFEVKPEPDEWVGIKKLKANNKKMRVNLWLAREKEKKMLEEFKSKDEEIEVLKHSVEFWKKKAESKRQGHKVEEQFQSRSKCYVRVNKVKMPSPPCLPPAWASPQDGSLAPSPGGADTRTREEQEGTGGELEEKQRESSIHLLRHKLVKTGEKLHSCSTCNKAFLSKSDLKRHQRRHSGEKPYSCDICHKSFTEVGNLKCHKRTHSGEKPYSCDICPKSFSQAGTLKFHKSTHSGEKPFICVICKEAFSLKKVLKRHELTHSGKKPHVCQICNKGFNRQDSLKVHKLKH